MAIRDIITIVVVMAGSVVGWAGLQERDAKLAAQAQQKLLQATVDSASLESDRSAQTLSNAQEVSRLAEDSLSIVTVRLKVVGDSLADVAAESVEAIEVSGANLAELLDSIEVYLPEPYKPLVDSARVLVEVSKQINLTVTDAFTAQQASFAEFMNQDADVHIALTDRAVAAETLAEDRRLEVLAERAAKDAAVELSTPGVLARIKTSLPFFSMQGTVAGGIGALLALAATH